MKLRRNGGGRVDIVRLDRRLQEPLIVGGGPPLATAEEFKRVVLMAPRYVVAVALGHGRRH